jgi:PAS domain S-box-containing protein
VNPRRAGLCLEPFAAATFARSLFPRQSLAKAWFHPLRRWLEGPRGRLAALVRWCWRPDTILVLLIAALVFLPVVMFSAISAATVGQMQLRAREISTLASGIRAYYADNVIARLQASPGKVVISENYRLVHGAIPIPATLSVELGSLFDNANGDGRMTYGFLSDYPFAKRNSRPLDDFEQAALDAFRRDPQRQTYSRLVGGRLGPSAYRLATPVLMRQACVTCHNTHPDSPKRDWKVGDVRGIQEVSVRGGMQGEGLAHLSPLLGYVGVVGLISVAATSAFQRQSRQLQRLNRQLKEVSQRETGLSSQLSQQLQELRIFGSVVDHSIISIAIADMHQYDLPLIYVNKAFTDLTGYGAELAIGYNCRFLQGPETDPRELERIRGALRSGSSYTGELVNYRKDGSRFWNRLTLYPVGGEPGAPDYFVANQVDVTSLRQQAGVPFDQLHALDSDIRAAQRALEEANRFGAALNAHRFEGLGQTVAAEALLRTEQQSRAELNHLLQRIAAALREHLGRP